MRDILIVVDMQNDFINGSLGTKEAEAIVKPAADLIRTYRPEDIIATRDTHERDYLSTQEGKNLPVEHCIKGMEGWQINPEIDEALRGAKVIDKPTFGSRKLAEEILNMSQSQEIMVTLIGLCTDICVISNALMIKAFIPEVPVRVVKDCCAGVTTISHEAAITSMRMCQVEII